MSLQNPPSRAQEQRDATREKIVQAARELVVERGYDDVSTADVLERAGVSRGGLYHHFDGKEQLFAAVIAALERDFIARLVGAVDLSDPFAALQSGAQWYLDEALRSVELRRVGLMEGRKAIGWDLWRQTITPYGFTVLSQALKAAIDTGQIKRADPDVLAQLILAMLIEATAIILAADDMRAQREATGQAVKNLIDGMAA
jgi:AcrR family transcriptional regulator